MKVLDLCCGVGGASQGISKALPGIHITGVDIKDQPDYFFGFVKADVTRLPQETFEIFDFIWASYPCQSYIYASKKSRNLGKEYPDLIAQGRKMLLKSGKPFVLENCTTAPIRKDLILCGQMFGLKVIRHRAFEIHGFEVQQPKHIKHIGTVRNGNYVTVAGHGGDGKASLKSWQNAMGIYWTKDKHSIAEAVPPIYSEFIFRNFLQQNDLTEVMCDSSQTFKSVYPRTRFYEQRSGALSLSYEVWMVAGRNAD